MEMPAIKIKFLDDVKFEMTFQDGKVIRYDIKDRPYIFDHRI